MIKTSVVKFSLTFLASLFGIIAVAQPGPTEEAQSIVAEGKLLYRLEMASWHGTDLFLENYPTRENIGGYFSYIENEIPTCIFFSKSSDPKVIGTILFDSIYNLKTAKIDLAERNFSEYENSLYTIRKTALAEINSDDLFKLYKNTKFNLIPLRNETQKKVYVLTGPQEADVVIFGNDYLLTFDHGNKLISKKQLHRNIIPIPIGQKEYKGKEIEGAMHTHLPETGDFITATDICTLMLYSKFANWKTYNVVSRKYLNIWDCKKEILTVVPMQTGQKKDREKKKKND